MYRQEITSFLCASVEIDVTTELKKSINIKDHKGWRLEQAVEYEWQPEFCKKCSLVGHDCSTKVTSKPPVHSTGLQK